MSKIICALSLAFCFLSVFAHAGGEKSALLEALQRMEKEADYEIMKHRSLNRNADSEKLGDSLVQQEMDAANEELLKLAQIDSGVAADAPYRTTALVTRNETLDAFALHYLTAIKLVKFRTGQEDVRMGNMRTSTAAGGFLVSIVVVAATILMIKDGQVFPELINMLKFSAVIGGFTELMALGDGGKKSGVSGLFTGASRLLQERKRFNAIKSRRKDLLLEGISKMRGLLAHVNEGRELEDILQKESRKLCPKLLTDKNP